MNTTIETHWAGAAAAEARCFIACDDVRNASNKAEAETALRCAAAAANDATRAAMSLDEYYAMHVDDMTADDEKTRDRAQQTAWRAGDMYDCAKAQVAKSYNLAS